MQKNKLLLIAAGIILILLALLFNAFKSLGEDLKGKDNLISFLNQKIEKQKSDLGVEKARVEVLQAENTKILLELQSADSTIEELQNLVVEYKKELKNSGSATVIQTVTKTVVDEKTVVEYRDTTIKGDTVYVYPTYYSDIKLEDWINARVLATRDTTNLNLSVKNKYGVVIGTEKLGLFKKGKRFAEVINYNPYTETKTVRTYEVKGDKPGRFSIGPVAGAGLGTSGIEPFIGVGIQYALIRF